jgi:transcriptional regulator with XRE-family HTH domain
MASSFGSKVKAYRLRSGLTQLELELNIESASGSISKIENNQTNPTKETLIKIADALSLSTMDKQHLITDLYSEPTEEEKLKVIEKTDSLLNSPNSFCYILDYKHRLIKSSKAFDSALKDFGYNPIKAQDKTIIEILLDPNLGIRDMISKDDYSDTVVPAISDFINESKRFPDDPWWKEEIEKLKQFPNAKEFFDREKNETFNFYDESTRKVTFKLYGVKIRMTYRPVFMNIDPRFYLVEYTVDNSIISTLLKVAR